MLGRGEVKEEHGAVTAVASIDSEVGQLPAARWLAAPRWVAVDDDVHAFVMTRIVDDEQVAPTALDPTRALAEARLKRRILERHQPMETIVLGEDHTTFPMDVCQLCGGLGKEEVLVPFPCPTVQAVAVVYAGHPGFRPEWGMAW
jgi:hypothetical protein